MYKENKETVLIVVGLVILAMFAIVAISPGSTRAIFQSPEIFCMTMKSSTNAVINNEIAQINQEVTRATTTEQTAVLVTQKKCALDILCERGDTNACSLAQAQPTAQQLVQAQQPPLAGQGGTVQSPAPSTMTQIGQVTSNVIPMIVIGAIVVIGAYYFFVQKKR